MFVNIDVLNQTVKILMKALGNIVMNIIILDSNAKCLRDSFFIIIMHVYKKLKKDFSPRIQSLESFSNFLLISILFL
jgi:hypothetical protein